MRHWFADGRMFRPGNASLAARRIGRTRRMVETPESGCRLEQDRRLPAGRIALYRVSRAYPRPLGLPRRAWPGSPKQVMPGANVTR
jgi:hypothetical protein